MSKSVLTNYGSRSEVPYRNIDLDESAVAISAVAGEITGWYIYNNAASTRYIKLYDVAQGSITVGTTPPAMTIPLPAGAASSIEWKRPIPFKTAISAAATTDVDGNGAPANNDVVVNFLFR